MVITTVSSPAFEISQPFFSFANHSGTARRKILCGGDLILDHTPSTVIKQTDGGGILKLIKARSWHEYAKSLWARSRLFKEVRGNQLLAGLGLKVAEIREVGIALLPTPRYRYLGYYIMENLESRGAVEMLQLFDSGISEAKRIQWLDLVIDDLRRMRDSGIVFSDCHLRNVFADFEACQVIWIDTGVTRYHWRRSKRFARKFNHSIRRMADYHDKHLLLSSEEKRRLLALLLPE
ncbi:hypothetical protein [Oceanobacter mangrovi]|uniref:hypothetical protein n=1 Tax=Oceanobacter mangrovi TaxID=2862510 RepID=UPI001C8E45C5|nr:hypothetical protein [Oceanobacter mangrovi]